ncbi:hypothetical protein PG988_015502, partial [Apiospora saccharicola]
VIHSKSASNMNVSIIFIFLIFAGLLCILYRWALPKPIPGIPCDSSAARSIWGNMPDVMAFKRRHGEVRPWFAHQAVKHRSPLTQAWMTPFSKPVLILSDYREAQDVFLRRGRDFFRGPRSCDNFHGLIPEHHIAMMSADPRFKRNKELVRDLMTPGFLHQVSAPEIHNKSMMLVDLWTHKSRLARGRPFDALADMFDVAVDMINAATFAQDDDMSTTKMQLDFLLGAGDSSASASTSTSTSTWTPEITSVDARGAVSFPRLPEPPDIEACRVLSEHVGVLFNSLAPRLEDRWRLLTSPRLRACVRRKDAMIRREIERSLERIAGAGGGGGGGDGDGATMGSRSALDHLLQREQAAATKEGRKPEFHSRKIYDELLGYIVAGHETSATGLCSILSITTLGMIKLLATHQDVQAVLRATLRAAFVSAASELRQPTADEITLTSVPYLDAVLEESLRYAPPIPLLIRTAMVDTTLLGYPVPKGTNVFMPALGPGYTAPPVPVAEGARSETSRTKGWGGRWDEGDMHRFRPERWLQVDEDGTQRFNSRAGPMITFGLGPRSCFGKRLAYLEMRMVLSLLVWNFEFQKVEGSLASNDVHESITTCPRSCYVALKHVFQEKE